MQGKATANYANGDIYEGQFENGIRQGSGVYTCPCLLTYWRVGCRYLKGDVFTGSFENNLKTGLGRITLLVWEALRPAGSEVQEGRLLPWPVQRWPAQW